MKTRIWIALLALYIVWGSTYLAIRFAVESIPPFLMASSRFLTAGLLLFTWRRLVGDPLPTWQELRSTAVVGIFLLLGGNGLVSWAEQRVPSGIAALLIGAMPLWFVLIDALRPGGALPARKTVLGIVVGFVGIVLLIGPGEFLAGGEPLDLPGVGALLLAGFLWSVGSIYGRDARMPASPLLATSLEMLVGGAALALAGTLYGEWGRLDLAAVTLRSLGGLLYLIFFGSLVGFVSYVWLLKNAPTPLVATYAYANPVVAIFLGNLLAQETLTVRVLLAALIIVSAVVLINRRAESPEPALEANSASSLGEA